VQLHTIEAGSQCPLGGVGEQGREDLGQGRDRRAVLAEWLTGPENPWFAKNLANIAWAQYLGRGIVDRGQ